MKKILTLKHWQLVVLIVLPSIWTLSNPWMDIALSFSGTVLLIWLYSIGFYGQTIISSLGLNPMNLKLFRLNIFLLPFLIVASRLIRPTNDITFDITDLSIAVLGIYSGFAAIQVILFAAKTIAKIECKREVMFGDYFQNFFQIACFILGIWTLQPRLNRLFRTEQYALQ